MTTWIGIDEAGYGPRLGPLCLGLVAVRGLHWDSDFWKTLAPEISRDPRQWRERPVICDSKELHKPKKGVEIIETAALSLCPEAPGFQAWLEQRGGFSTSDMARYPWYAQDVELPRRASGDRLVAHRQLWNTALQRQGLEVPALLVKPVLTRHFNSMLKEANKNAVEFTCVMGLLDRALSLLPGEDIQVDVDKLGGRDRYGDLLASHFPMEDIQILTESRHLSHYALPGRRLEIRFKKGADRDSGPAAAASLLAKYCREMFMDRLNTWWGSKIPGLAPTAGYPEDARRWLEVVRPHLLDAGYSESWISRDK